MYDEAVVELKKDVQLSGDSPTSMANLARAYVASGKRSEAVKLLGDLKRRTNPGYSNAAEIAMIYASLGDADQAMTWLEKGFEERFNPGFLLRPGFDPIRSALPNPSAPHWPSWVRRSASVVRGCASFDFHQLITKRQSLLFPA
jgi:hypothetical protein